MQDSIHVVHKNSYYYSNIKKISTIIQKFTFDNFIPL